MWNARTLLCVSAVSAAALVGVYLLGPSGGTVARGADLDRMLPVPLVDETPQGTGMETLTGAGGGFWGFQGVFQHARGVVNAVSGYDGGAASTAQYEVVSGGATGHAESVRITYDPHVISYGHLLQIFFSVTTDPTQLDQQYPDQGTQYRSEIFTTTPEQAAIARDYIEQLGKAHVFSQPIVTQIGKDTGFYRAEGYHQNYLTLHPDSLYIATFDLSKVAALKTVFPEQFVEKPVLVTPNNS